MCKESRRSQVAALKENLWPVEPTFTMLLSFPSIRVFFFFNSVGIFLSMPITERYSRLGDRAAIGKRGGEGKSGLAELRCDDKHPPNPSSSI